MMFSKKKKEYVFPVQNPNCTEPEVNNWEISQFVIDKLVPVTGVHPFPLTELMLLTSATCLIKPSYIFEWGTNIGKSARVFYEIKEVFKIPCEVHSVDLPDDVEHNEHPKENRGHLVKGLKDVHLHLGDGVAKSLEVYEAIGKNKPVLFFVDGDHSYDSVYRELKMILQTVPHAGVLLHDTFYQSPESKYNVGPRKAIEDVMKELNSSKRIIHVGMGLPGMSFIY